MGIFDNGLKDNRERKYSELLKDRFLAIAKTEYSNSFSKHKQTDSTVLKATSKKHGKLSTWYLFPDNCLKISIDSVVWCWEGEPGWN